MVSCIAVATVEERCPASGPASVPGVLWECYQTLAGEECTAECPFGSAGSVTSLCAGDPPTWQTPNLDCEVFSGGACTLR